MKEQADLTDIETVQMTGLVLMMTSPHKMIDYGIKLKARSLLTKYKQAVNSYSLA